jgi:putative zinc finger protein
MTTDDTHLTAEDVAAFLDRRMTAAERAGAEAHLAGCQLCREELRAVHGLLRSRPGVRPAVFIPAGLAAAAAIAFVAVTLVRGDPDAADRVRTAPAAEAARIAVRVPADGDTIAPGRPVLVWSSIAGEPTYRLTLTDASGQPLWTSTTSDTSVALPPQVVLQSRQTYFWYVDALRADGRAASTGVRRFTTP